VGRVAAGAQRSFLSTWTTDGHRAQSAIVFAKTDAAARAEPRWPLPIRTILGNRACERFSFFGLQSILVAFLAGHLLSDLPPGQRETRAQQVFHLFAFVAYLFPLLGGWLADRFWGKYRTTLGLSLVGCAGYICLAVFDQGRGGFYPGLWLVALGTGALQPAVTTLVGDQLTADQKSRATAFYGALYWIVTLVSLASGLLMPLLLRHLGSRVALGLPAVLMAAATVLLWLGRRHYRELPLIGPNPDSPGQVILTAIRTRKTSARAGGWLDRSLEVHPRVAVDAVRTIWRLTRIFALLTIFWALFDQRSSSWALQAWRMDLQLGPFTLAPAQLLWLNPILLLALIPLMTGLLYPWLTRLGIRPTPLRRMTAGLLMAGVAFALSALIEQRLDEGQHLSVLWQIGPYLALTLAEVLVAVTGLEFAYTQAPPSMKGTIMSLWLVSAAVGNLLVATLVARLNFFSGPQAFLFYAALATTAALTLALLSRRLPHMDFFRVE
jgi:POT family proton-dependent oligopeptide transporter